MKPYPEPIDLKKIRVLPLAQRDSLSSIDKILIRPEQAAPACSDEVNKTEQECAAKINGAMNGGDGFVIVASAVEL